MSLDTETFLVYSDEREFKKRNQEEVKKEKEIQSDKRSKKLNAKVIARNVAVSHGMKLGRWTGTFARIKSGQNAGQWFTLFGHQTVSERPGSINEQ